MNFATFDELLSARLLLLMAGYFGQGTIKQIDIFFKKNRNCNIFFKISDLRCCRESRKGNRELEGNNLPSRQSKQYFEPTFFLNVFALALNIVGFYVYVVTANSLLLNAVSEKSFQFVFIYYLIPVCILMQVSFYGKRIAVSPLPFTLKS